MYPLFQLLLLLNGPKVHVGIAQPITQFRSLRRCSRFQLVPVQIFHSCVIRLILFKVLPFYILWGSKVKIVTPGRVLEMLASKKITKFHTWHQLNQFHHHPQHHQHYHFNHPSHQHANLSYSRAPFQARSQDRLPPIFSFLRLLSLSFKCNFSPWDFTVISLPQFSFFARLEGSVFCLG